MARALGEYQSSVPRNNRLHMYLRTVEISCPLTLAPVTCFQVAHGGGNVHKTSRTVASSDISYREVNVTSLKKQKDKGKAPKTVTLTKKPSPTDGAPTATAKPGSSEDSGLSVGDIAGIAVACVVVVLLVMATCIATRRKHRRRQNYARGQALEASLNR